MICKDPLRINIMSGFKIFKFSQISNTNNSHWTVRLNSWVCSVLSTYENVLALFKLWLLKRSNLSDGFTQEEPKRWSHTEKSCHSGWHQTCFDNMKDLHNGPPNKFYSSDGPNVSGNSPHGPWAQRFQNFPGEPPGPLCTGLFWWHSSVAVQT